MPLLAAAPLFADTSCSIPAGPPPGTLPGLMYQWRILSMTGQTPADGGAPLTLLDEPSINENGAVAFLGELSGGGEGVIAVSPTLSQTVVSFADPVSNRTFGPYVQINDASQVLALPPRLRRWTSGAISDTPFW